LLREAQRKTLSLPNTGMAVALDVGEWNDIHPLDKQTVGERLASAATAVLSGKSKKVVGGGPLPTHAKLVGNSPATQELIVSFDSIGKGLVAKGLVAKESSDNIVNHVAIAGADKKFVWAKAVVKGNHLVISAGGVASPQFIRYAWADNPEGANLYNANGYPASSFELSVNP